MLTGLGWLALEVKYLDRARSFYESFLDLQTVRETETEVALAAGDTDLVLRRPEAVPRGGLHTHFALSTPHEEYDAWKARLSESFDLVEHQFGDAKSLYFYDVDGNCVEIGQRSDEGAGITGVFEIVLEVADLDRAEAFYRALGLEVMGRGDERRRVRLTAGSFDLELWEPQLGLADGRGGVHVDVGFETDDPDAAVDAVEADACSVERLPDEARIVDPDGHHLTFR
ncbi:VOC family protein [Halorientalis salina]|uniref:VOC family protein n=1 Tax=Halorientalis salina TaxID=2932266 RepID=UPI0010AD2130|nr:VOC family protein [Halorientalis salina]